AEILVEPKRAADRARDLRHLERMRQSRPVVIALVIDEDLRLVLQPPEGSRMDDAVAVALEGTARAVLGLLVQAAATCPRQGRIGCERLRSPQTVRHGRAPTPFPSAVPRRASRARSTGFR